MILLFDKNETNFNHNETLLEPYKCRVLEKANANFELAYESCFDGRIEDGKVIKAPTPRGMQLFRLYNTKHQLHKTTAKARHIFYDLSANWLEDVRAVSQTGPGALNVILGGTLYPHRFTGSSTVTNSSSRYFVRQNPVQAMLGDGGLISRWGGFIKRDNFHVDHIPFGRDLGYDIRYGKNLKGITVEVDDTDVITRLMPTWVVDNVVQMLPEKYIDSPNIDFFPHPIVGEFRVNVPENVTDQASYVRAETQKAFQDGVDKPSINYTFDFVVLRDLPEYRDYRWVEELDLYDTVTITVPKMEVRLNAALMSYEYDCIKERFINAEIGDAKSSMAKSISRSMKQVEEKIEVKSSEILQKQQEATDKLSGVKGGNIVIVRDDEGLPYEILIMDTDDVATAKNVLRLNQQGAGFSSKGILGPYGVAITIDGHIVADYITTGTLDADLMRTGLISDSATRNFWNLDTGALNVGNGDIYYNPLTSTTEIRGTTKLANSIIDTAHIATGAITSAKIANLAVDTAQIATGAITSAKISSLSADKITAGTIDARTITINGISLSNVTRGNLDTPTASIGYSKPFEMSGSALSVGANSSYIKIRDLGSRGEIDVNGTIRAYGTSYGISLDAGGVAFGSSLSSLRRAISNSTSYVGLCDRSGSELLLAQSGSLYLSYATEVHLPANTYINGVKITP